MSDALPRHKHEHVLVSVHGKDGLDCVELDRAGRLRVLVHNHTGRSYALSPRAGPGLPPHLHVDLSSLGEVELDPAAVAAPGWRVLAWSAGVLALEPVGVYGWFLDGTLLAVDLGSVTVRGGAGPGMVTVELERFAPEVDGRFAVAVMRLATGCAEPNAVALAWEGDARVRVTPRHAKARANTLRLRVPVANPDDELYLSTATQGSGRYHAIASAGWMEEMEVAAEGGWRAERAASAGMPVWRIYPAGGVHGCSDELVAVAEPESTVELELSSVVSDQPAGEAQVVTYTSVGYAVGTVSLVEEGSVAINSFTADPTTIGDITEPASVLLSWEVDNATNVTLSGVGVVDASVKNYQVFVEQTTTFVLTAFDASLSSISSEAVTVAVSPSLSSRMVPARTILLWQGQTASIPSGWALCDGTSGTPDLSGRFVMGADPGGGVNPGTSGDADTHTHDIQQLQKTFDTSYGGAHAHGMPTSWYHRSLSSGGKTGIDTDGTFNTNTQTQSAGDHSHSVSVTFPGFTSGVNSDGVRPPWYALAYIMKLSTTS